MTDEKTQYQLLTDKADEISQKIFDDSRGLFMDILEEYKELQPEDNWMSEELIGALLMRMGTHIAYEASLLWGYKVRDE